MFSMDLMSLRSGAEGGGGGGDLGFHTARTEPHVGGWRGGVRWRHGRTGVLHRHLPAPQGLEGGGQPGGADVVCQRGDGGAAVGREPVLLQPLRDEVGVVVVAGHGELRLQQHRVDVGVVGVGQQLAQVLLVSPACSPCSPNISVGPPQSPPSNGGENTHCK